MKPRKLIVSNDIALVPLTNGMFSLIDAELADEIGKYNWQSTKPIKSKHYYASSNIRNTNGKRTMLYMHRAIWEYKFGSIPDGMQIDHILREETLNNRLKNLRLADSREQRQNQGIPSNAIKTQSNLAGVHWHKEIRKWNASIKYNGKRIHLGYYDTDEEGYGAYYWALKLMGENPPINHKRDHPQKVIISAKTRQYVEKQLRKYSVDIIG